MPKIKLDAVTIDCPDSKALVTFYHQLTGMRIVEVEDGFYPTLAGKTLDLVFQQIDNYQPPTWPTQERGQQIHLDCTCPDIEAAAKYAESIGATRAPAQPGDDWIVMFDPAGHPVCIAMPFTDPEEEEDEQQPQAIDASSKPNITVASASFDCPDNQALASFYAVLNDMTPIDMGDSDHSALLSKEGLPDDLPARGELPGADLADAGAWTADAPRFRCRRHRESGEVRRIPRLHAGLAAAR